ncbi:MAG TPA: cupin domain-containing protein [Vicinamibacterales bacterium]|nr:cupin domain-containing protein [Vicinamibacterales bacterium]
MLGTVASSMEQIRFGPGGGIYRIVATSADTRNTHFAFEATEPPGGGPPLHIHTREEEYFHVLEGEITFSIGKRVRKVKAGGSAFVPRGTPHCFKNTSNHDARVLVLFTPANIEGFFDFGRAAGGRVPSESELLERLVVMAPKYGLEVLGPSPL